jgi:hypothetical protein
MRPCPICLGPATIKAIDPGLREVSCKMCKTYRIEVAAMGSNLVPDEKRHILSGIVRNHFEQGEPAYISVENVRDILNSVSEPSVSKKNDLLLKHLRKKQPDSNTSVDLDAQTDYPILYAKNPGEFRHVLEQARDTRGYIKQDSEQQRFRYHRLSLKGWDRLDELDKLAEQEPSRETKLRETVDEFIQVTWLPDDFYKRLVDEINQLYTNQLPFSLSVLIRKLFENLTIDILRKRYGTQQLELYYDTSRRRFHDFSVLLQNLDENQTDFHYVNPDLDSSLIQRINQYRETGNSAAHSIEADLTIEQILTDRGNINYLVQYLLRMLQNI